MLVGFWCWWSVIVWIIEWVFGGVEFGFVDLVVFVGVGGSELCIVVLFYV